MSSTLRVSGNERSQDAGALEVRAFLNHSQGRFDLGQWLSTHLALGASSRLLSLGAGTGAQLVRYAPVIGGRGLCAAIDISAESLDVLADRARGAGMRAETLCVDMESLCDMGVAPHLKGLDHIVSAYALYYARQPRRLLLKLRDRLGPKGAITVIGPSPGNNAAWYALLRAAGASIPEVVRGYSETFLPEIVLPAAHEGFTEVHWAEARNPVTFQTPEALERYWTHTIYCQPEARPSVSRAIRRAFEARGSVTLDKRIGLVQMRGPLRS